jgi:hypothetical protein
MPQTADGTVNINIVTSTSTPMTITFPAPPNFAIQVPGIQGPKGDQNVYVGTTPPVNPQVDWIWIDTT